MANPPPSHYPDIGDFGEDLVAQWLQSTGWSILQRRFSCRWGEIDIIAQYPDSTLVFVEVKTRSPGNWDTWGKGAITLKKQVKIGRTAGIFLAKYPDKADYTCRFDVAIVCCLKISQNYHEAVNQQPALASSSAVGYNFQLQEYIPAAFDLIH
ncbi:TIGR00252 family protein [Nostoc sp. PCC 7524]|uniref:YraN family protein n=1 Tax=Nostoc sp. (strain ATCC 29411 / PCC 7524) TaxID=28072 RepID=UPI00029F0D66|nr:YraN family protein [Nostoc sp. PCC 7524]AFY50116.1 TIGR00252 family protein [Nostoc sp. PCC 7524]